MRNIWVRKWKRPFGHDVMPNSDKRAMILGLFLQPLTDIHLHSDLNLEFEAGGDIRYVYIFSAVAIFMLIIACINFMNLSTAGASKRAREVGIRKVLGSLKGQLVRQFLTRIYFDCCRCLGDFSLLWSTGQFPSLIRFPEKIFP